MGRFVILCLVAACSPEPWVQPQPAPEPVKVVEAVVEPVQPAPVIEASQPMKIEPSAEEAAPATRADIAKLIGLRPQMIQNARPRARQAAPRQASRQPVRRGGGGGGNWYMCTAKGSFGTNAGGSWSYSTETAYGNGPTQDTAYIKAFESCNSQMTMSAQLAMSSGAGYETGRCKVVDCIAQHR
jgi:hypothetical protein